jgi:hypothetical protein
MLFHNLNPQLMSAAQQERLEWVIKADTHEPQDKETGVKLNLVPCISQMNKLPETCCTCSCA